MRDWLGMIADASSAAAMAAALALAVFAGAAEWRAARPVARGLLLGLLPLMILAAVLRFSWLDRKLPWCDEGLTAVRVSGHLFGEVSGAVDAGTTLADVRRATLMEGGAGSFLLHSVSRAADVHPPFYFALLRLWAEAFGEDPARLRAFSALAGVFLLPAVVWLALEASGSRAAAWLAAAFVAVSPYQVLYAQEARSYTLLGLLAVLSTAALLRAERAPRRRTLVLYGALSALGALTHALFFMVWGAQVAYLLLPGGSGERSRQPLLLAGGLGTLAAAPWGMALLFRGLYTRMAWVARPPMVEHGGVIAGLGTALFEGPRTANVAAGIVLLLASAAGWTAAERGTRVLVGVVMLGVAAPLALDLATGAHAGDVTRFVGVPGLFALVALGWALALAVQRLPRAGPPIAGLVLVASLASSLRVGPARDDERAKEGPGWTRAVAALETAGGRPILALGCGGDTGRIVAFSLSVSREVRVVRADKAREAPDFLQCQSPATSRLTAQLWRARVEPIGAGLSRVVAPSEGAEGAQ